MTTYIEGRQSTASVLADERRVDIPPEIYWLSKDLTPLLHISEGGSPDGHGLPVKSRECINPEFKILEKENRGRWTAVNYSTGYTAGAVTMVLDAVSHINVGDQLKNVVKDEIVHVTAKSNTDKTVTVTRAFGATAAVTTWADNEPVLRLASLWEENGAAAAALGVQNRKRTNYTGIFKKSLGLSGTAENSEYYGGDKHRELKEEMLLEIKKDIEYAFLWSEPFEDTDGGPNSQPIRATGGLWYWANEGGGTITTATTTFTKSGWMTFARTSFEQGDADTRVALCAPLIIEMLDYWKDGKLNMTPRDFMYDLRVAEWETGNGRLIIVRDKILEYSPAGTTTAGYGGTCIVVDPKLVIKRYLRNRDLAIELDIIKDGKDGRTDQYKGEIGLEVINPENISILTAVATYT